MTSLKCKWVETKSLMLVSLVHVVNVSQNFLSVGLDTTVVFINFTPTMVLAIKELLAPHVFKMEVGLPVPPSIFELVGASWSLLHIGTLSNFLTLHFIELSINFSESLESKHEMGFKISLMSDSNVIRDHGVCKVSKVKVPDFEGTVVDLFVGGILEPDIDVRVTGFAFESRVFDNGKDDVELGELRNHVVD